ncbi:MAG TPA: sigma-70 family RNA polymerase sigma factor [Ardenticatenaceae bacterium]|jgi:RNA polymerase sigma factor (sigma-70 family)
MARTKKSERNLEEIIELVRNGEMDEQEGFSIVVEEASPYIIGVVRKQVAIQDEEQIDDLAATAWVDIWRNIDLYDPEAGASFKTWASTIAIRRSIDYVRKAALTPEVGSLDEPTEGSLQEEQIVPAMGSLSARGSLPLDELIAKELQSAVMRILLELPAFDRTLYLLRVNYDISYAELAEIASEARGKPLSVKAVQNRIYRLQEFIANRLRAEGFLDVK